MNIIPTYRSKVSRNHVTDCALTEISKGWPEKARQASSHQIRSPGARQESAISGRRPECSTGERDGCVPNSPRHRANPAAKSNVVATNKGIILKDSQAYSLDGSTPANTYTNMMGPTMGGDGNTFTVSASVQRRLGCLSCAQGFR